MLKTLSTVGDYILTHKVNLVIASIVTGVALAIFVDDKELKISLLPRTPAN